MLNHTYIQNNVLFCFLAPYARTTRYEEAFFPLEYQRKKDSLRLRASLLVIGGNEAPPHYLQ